MDNHLGERVAVLETEMENLKESFDDLKRILGEQTRQLHKIEKFMYMILGAIVVVEFGVRVIEALHGSSH